MKVRLRKTAGFTPDHELVEIRLRDNLYDDTAQLNVHPPIGRNEHLAAQGSLWTVCKREFRDRIAWLLRCRMGAKLIHSPLVILWEIGVLNGAASAVPFRHGGCGSKTDKFDVLEDRSEEHTSELQSPC